ncbi:MAG: L-histidine N(alpha)-methyltransferase [Drouetiella hepatica Uher 2000/2452]|jgi:dimethylhistidine N-methyltransferase|uniref:L-histidine N(Alpha)-methyltransferase n=1 Tax=Drouetiella hepatica Uher 2000/2452 TaxID=904376 RepID=A0A951UQJ7_9CYAN|nr:L-histidine N(alpha)-methyltransferase [Drouetiella hepatica Uher 2000/2452]
MTLTFDPIIQFYDLQPEIDDFRTSVLQGLTQPQKAIAPQFLYDKRGSELFDAICTLEEYYLTRTEVRILQENAAEIAKLIGDGVLIEFGSGSSQKVRILLNAAPQIKTYVALDISKQHLCESCTNLMQDYRQLETIAICTDYMRSLHLPHLPSLQNQYKVGFFPGSSIGNLEPDEALTFLKKTAAILESGGLLIGVDLKKSREILEPAYDDAQGISAEFALNLLARINSELGADFNLDQFSYQAHYNPIGRIEMHIVSLKEQVVHLDGVEIHFYEGERLRTEYSYKYTIAEFQTLATQAGFQPKCVWTDTEQLFSVHYLTL